MKRIARPFVLLACLAAAPAAAQPPDPVLGQDVSTFQRFLAYPHLQRGFTAMERGDARQAIAAFERARAHAPRSPDTALYLADAYRHFGMADRAEATLAEQRRYTPGDPRLRTPAPATATAARAPAVVDACDDPASAACRVRRGQRALQDGDLAAAEAQLQDAAFAAGADGVSLRRALAQRAIHRGDAAVAERQFAALHAAGALDAGEREQWFNLLLARGGLAEARGLQSGGALQAPEQQLAYADALAASGDRAALAAYLSARQPAFAGAADEYRWLRLLERASRDRPQLLTAYRPRHAANRAVHARLALPLAMAGDDAAAAQRLVDLLPPASFRETRFDLALRAGRHDDAAGHAAALLRESPDAAQLLDPLSYRLAEAGAQEQALQLLMAAWPFAAGSDAELLSARLALLASERPGQLAAHDLERLRQPLPTPAQRSAQASLLAAMGDCDGVRGVLADQSPDYPARSWMQLGDCHRDARPGLAQQAYAEALKRQPDADVARALAYQAYATGDYDTALRSWQSLPQAELQPADLLAAASTAFAAGNRDAARVWLDASAGNRGPENDAYWWLRAELAADEDPQAARSALERALAIREDARYHASLAGLQQEAGEPARALASLQRAHALAPDDTAIDASLAYAYLRAGQPDRARPHFERLRLANPDDPRLAEELVYLNQRLGDRVAAQRHARSAIDVIDDAGPAAAEEEQARRYRLRRLHETLGRRWSVTADMVIGDTVAAAANASVPGSAYRSYAQVEAQYRFGHVLRADDNDALAVYARVFAGSGPDRDLWPVHTPTLGVGARWKPLRDHVFFVALEQQVPLDNGDGTHSDLMLRLSASPLRNARYNDDWHPVGESWLSQSVYLDAAHYFRGGHSVFTADYQVGYHRKLSGAQTIEPYVRLQFNGLRRSGGGTDTDVRGGIGLRWNRWYGESRYDAYRRRFSVGVEWQHAFDTYLDERDAVFVSVGNRW